MRFREQGSFRRAPQQERARTTVDAIFEATARLADQSGIEGATTAKIAHLAGVSIGSLYQYFPKKDALISALTQDTMGRDLERIDVAIDQSMALPMEQATRHILEAALAFALEKPRLFVWMLRYLPQLGVLPAVEKFENELIVRMERFLLARVDELGIDARDVNLYASLGVGATRGGLLVLARTQPDVIADKEKIVGLLTELALGGWRARKLGVDQT